MEMELDLNAVVETAAAVRCEDSAASSALNAASGTVEASAGGSTPWQQQQPMALTFTMLRPDDGGGTPGQQQLVTQELFPVMPPGRSGGSGLWERAGVVEQAAKKKSRRGPRSRSSEYRGVTFYRRTSRWESHIWDCGKQVYLGGFDTAHAAARAYDRAAIKFRGMGADINFNVRDYDEDMKQMKQLSKEEVVRLLRRRQMTAGCLSRGRYDCGRCMGGGHGVYLQVEAARASYDKAAIKCNGREEAVTNLEPASIYDGDHDEIMLNQLHTQQDGVDVDLNLSISQPSAMRPAVAWCCWYRVSFLLFSWPRQWLLYEDDLGGDGSESDGWYKGSTHISLPQQNGGCSSLMSEPVASKSASPIYYTKGPLLVRKPLAASRYIIGIQDAQGPP